MARCGQDQPTMPFCQELKKKEGEGEKKDEGRKI